MKRILVWTVILCCCFTSIVGCDMMGDAINANLNANIDVNTTSELGQNTLDRIDDINETLNSGVEVGKDTRDMINDLNETIANGLKAGFDDDTLSRVDELLRVVEDGLKIGLDSETLNTIDGMVNTIDQMPGNWETSGQNIIQTLENAAGSTAKNLADEVTNLMTETRLNYQQMTAITGVEFRCNVDFMGSKVGATAKEFIGKSIVGKLKMIIAGTQQEETVPIPWVCQINPDTLNLSKFGDQLVYEKGVVTVTGYNFVDGNSPTATIVNEAGSLVPGITLYPYRTSPYQMQVNLQDLDLSVVPARSRLVFTWPNVAESSGIAVLIPGHGAPVASFIADKMSGNAPLTVQFTDTSTGNPTEWTWTFGDGTTDHNQNPSHQFIESKDFNVQLSVKNSQGQNSVITTISVGTELVANFNFAPSAGEVGIAVGFLDTSTGSPTSWQWDFGDGSSTSSEQNPTHVYINPNPNGYQVKLMVQNGSATSYKFSTDRIKIVAPFEAQFKANKVSGKPPFEVSFTDISKGGDSIIGWSWDFGDGTPLSTVQSPKHTFNTYGNFDVKLTIIRADGKKDVEKKEAYINSFRLAIFGHKILGDSIPNNSVYFTSFNVGTGGTTMDTKIPSSQYICGVNGFTAKDGVIFSPHMNKDGLRAYMFTQNSPSINQQTWWLIADFQDYSFPNWPKETWSVNVICFNKTLEKDYVLYRDDFRNISGGTPKKTGIASSDYSYCGVMGIAGLGATGFMFGVEYPLIIQQTVSTSDDQWVINSDMDVMDGGDTWNTPIICIKRGSYQNMEKPPFLIKEVYFQTSISTKVSTDISTSDYLCGINGFTGEQGDLFALPPLQLAFFDPLYIRQTVFNMRAYQQNGFWWVEGDIASAYKPENWTVSLLCVKKPIAVEGMPPK